MAYRAPRYCYIHAARDAYVMNSSAITISRAAHDDYPIVNMIDDRAGTIFQFDTSVSGASIFIDLDPNSTATWQTGLDRLIIPANHNLETIQVWEDDYLDFQTGPGPYSLSGVIDTVAGEQIDVPFTVQTQTRQFIRLSVTYTAQHFFSQFFLTKVETLGDGPDIADSPDGYRANVTRLEQPDGQSPTVLHGPQQRVMEYNYKLIEGADLATMEAMIAEVGMDRPFWVDPASFSDTPETDDPPIWMKFHEMPESRHTVLVPMRNAESKAFSLRLIESLD